MQGGSNGDKRPGYNSNPSYQPGRPSLPQPGHSGSRPIVGGAQASSSSANALHQPHMH